MIIPVFDNNQSVEKKRERRGRVFSLTSTVRIDESRCRGSRIFSRRLGDPTDEELVAVGRSGVEVFGRDVGRGRQRARYGCHEAAEVRASAVDVADGQLGQIGLCGYHRRHGRLDLGIQLEGHGLLRFFLVYLDGLRSERHDFSRPPRLAACEPTTAREGGRGAILTQLRPSRWQRSEALSQKACWV
jgi:hypothetical protein